MLLYFCSDYAVVTSAAIALLLCCAAISTQRNDTDWQTCSSSAEGNAAAFATYFSIILIVRIRDEIWSKVLTCHPNRRSLTQ